MHIQNKLCDSRCHLLQIIKKQRFPTHSMIHRLNLLHASKNHLGYLPQIPSPLLRPDLPDYVVFLISDGWSSRLRRVPRLRRPQNAIFLDSGSRTARMACRLWLPENAVFLDFDDGWSAWIQRATHLRWPVFASFIGSDGGNARIRRSSRHRRPKGADAMFPRLGHIRIRVHRTKNVQFNSPLDQRCPDGKVKRVCGWWHALRLPCLRRPSRMEGTSLQCPCKAYVPKLIYALLANPLGEAQLWTHASACILYYAHQTRDADIFFPTPLTLT
jgi:hypothetical protein